MSEESGFWNVSASDVIGAYLQKEQNDNETAVKMLESQAAIQQAALHSPQMDSMQDAVNTGYAAPVNAQTVQSYFARVPKPLLYGSVALLVGALALKAVK